MGIEPSQQCQLIGRKLARKLRIRWMLKVIEPLINHFVRYVHWR
jgi:hypothetical protein